MGRYEQHGPSILQDSSVVNTVIMDFIGLVKCCMNFLCILLDTFIRKMEKAGAGFPYTRRLQPTVLKGKQWIHLRFILLQNKLFFAKLCKSFSFESRSKKQYPVRITAWTSRINAPFSNAIMLKAFSLFLSSFGRCDMYCLVRFGWNGMVRFSRKHWWNFYKGKNTVFLHLYSTLLRRICRYSYIFHWNVQRDIRHHPARSADTKTYYGELFAADRKIIINAMFT